MPIQSDSRILEVLVTIDYIHFRRRLIKTIHNGSVAYCLQSLCEKSNSWIQSSIMYSTQNNSFFELQRLLMDIPYSDNLRIATKGEYYIIFTKGNHNKEEVHIMTTIFNEETEKEEEVLIRDYLLCNKYNAYSFFLFV